MAIYIFTLMVALCLLYLSRAITTRRVDNTLFIKSTLHITNSSSLLIMLSFACMVLVSGLRYNVGTDYPEYVNLFRSISNREGFFSKNIEPVFIILVKMINLFSSNPVWMFLATSIFTLYFVYKSALKSTRMYELSIFL